MSEEEVEELESARTRSNLILQKETEVNIAAQVEAVVEVSVQNADLDGKGSGWWSASHAGPPLVSLVQCRLVSHLRWCPIPSQIFVNTNYWQNAVQLYTISRKKNMMNILGTSSICTVFHHFFNISVIFTGMIFRMP